MRATHSKPLDRREITFTDPSTMLNSGSLEGLDRVCRVVDVGLGLRNLLRRRCCCYGRLPRPRLRVLQVLVGGAFKVFD
ncbi:hypothetical protein OIU77_017708 [Salix suchowensis]|uniref:Uncharacterized protein n=1 Tax=Salix suchowensis TaxID=1278906 RepID=A0ABQ8ZPU0_9ROSI|nr:hypothetical protein OIU77_017708 [Salix suchowensis]